MATITTRALLPTLGVLAFGAAVYLSGIWSLSWFSDDYVLVYSLRAAEMPPLADALRQGGGGNWSAARPLTYPLIGYLPELFGTAGVRAFQLLSHLVTAGLLGGLLLRLGWGPLAAALACAFFVLAPWNSQPVIWWSAVCTSVSTVMLLLAAHAYLGWRTAMSANRRSIALILVIVLSLLALLFYELWLGGFLLFWSLEYLLRSEGRVSADNTWVWRCAIALLPFVLFALAYMLTISEGAPHQPQLDWARVPIVFMSIQLRVYHWITDIPWGLSWQESGAALLNLGSVALLLVGGTLVFLGARTRGKTHTPTLQILPTLLFAWVMFLAGRLIFIAQGGIALHTRHNYGASLAVAVGIGALYVWLTTRFPACHRPAQVLVCLVLALLALTTAGISAETAANSRAEQTTYAIARDALSPNTKAVVVVGTPRPRRTELAYFSENSGAWLAHRLNKLQPMEAFVVDEIVEERDVIRLNALRGGEWRLFELDRSSTVLLRWKGGELKRDSTR